MAGAAAARTMFSRSADAGMERCSPRSPNVTIVWLLQGLLLEGNVHFVAVTAPATLLPSPA